MEAYKVSAAGNFTLIERSGQAFIVKVYPVNQPAQKQGTALLEGTLYKEEGSFMQVGAYVFEAVSKYFEPITTAISLEDFKSAAAFYFMSVLQTELYLVGIPAASALCPREMQVFEFER